MPPTSRPPSAPGTPLVNPSPLRQAVTATEPLPASVADPTQNASSGESMSVNPGELPGSKTNGAATPAPTMASGAVAPAPAIQSLPPQTKEELERIGKQFSLSPEKLRSIVDQFVSDLRLGLSKYGEPMAMIPTYVTGVPSGDEKGTFLALDLGGTNLRVCEVTLEGNHKFSLRQQKYKVSTELKTGEATVLFDYMADSVDHFLTQMAASTNVEDDIHLGLTFSFPVEQSALDKGVLLTWTKGFSAKNAIGNDVVKLLQDAFDRKHLHVRCTALVNDTVGTLMSRAYLSGGNCILGAIFGTGTNGAYVEKIDNIKKLGPEIRERLGPSAQHMIINGEWGAFDNARRVLPVSQFDNKLDRESINPRFQLFEKFISGMYQGEICRNLLLYLVDNGYLFNGHSSAQLNSHYGFDTSVMSDIETPAPEEIAKVDPASLKPAHIANTSKTSTSVRPNPEPDMQVWHAHTPEELRAVCANSSLQSLQTRKILVEQMGFQPQQVSDDDTEIVLWACRTVATRAARLSACAVATVLEQTGMVGQNVDVGVDGSMVQFYPGFEDRLRGALRDLVGAEAEKNVVIGMAKDGSGVGAALGALQAKKQSAA
ncbi:glucokinase [Tulasnella sp. JGI-2019a]|nr:glucokinase [Tulasnella sp. JGI-2019a]